MFFQYLEGISYFYDMLKLVVRYCKNKTLYSIFLKSVLTKVVKIIPLFETKLTSCYFNNDGVLENDILERCFWTISAAIKVKMSVNHFSPNRIKTSALITQTASKKKKSVCGSFRNHMNESLTLWCFMDPSDSRHCSFPFLTDNSQIDCFKEYVLFELLKPTF